MIKVKQLADYIIWYCHKDGRLINNYELQTILFKLQSYFISKYNIAIYKDDAKFMKWGPMVPDVYYEYSSFARYPILKIKLENKHQLEQVIDKDIINDIKQLIDNERSRMNIEKTILNEKNAKILQYRGCRHERAIKSIRSVPKLYIQD